MNSLLVFSEDPEALVAFYTKLFEKAPEWSGGKFNGWKTGAGYLMIGPHDKVKGKNTRPERMIFNFETADVEKEFKRVEKLGAKVIAKPYHPGEDTKMTLATFADPDGNYFQFASPMK